MVACARPDHHAGGGQLQQPTHQRGDRTNSFTSKHIAEQRVTVLQQLAVFDPAVFIAEFIA
jgi:hypothetical protein